MNRNYFSLKFCELKRQYHSATHLFICDQQIYAFGPDAQKVSKVIGSQLDYRLDVPQLIQPRTCFCFQKFDRYLKPLSNALGQIALNDPLLNADDRTLYDSLKESL